MYVYIIFLYLYKIRKVIMKITLVMGIQGSGKSTLSIEFQKRFGFVHVSTGDLLRDHIKNETTFGKIYKSAYEKGEMAPDKVLYGIIQDALFGYLGDDVIILDGFPRNMTQVKWLESKYNVIDCILITLPIAVATGRLLNRGRVDDTESAIETRFALYKEHTKPIIDHYESNKKLVMVNGDQSVEDMYREAVDKMGRFTTI